MVIQVGILFSETIILEAEEVWNDSKQVYRDASIRVGGLLASFVLARLKEADSYPESMRIALFLTRERSMKIAAERLGMKLTHAWEKVRISKVVELFGNPGELSYSSLRAFTVFIQRRFCKVSRNRHINTDTEVTSSESEKWEIKLDCVGRDPMDIYRQAVKECWSSTKIREIIGKEVNLRRRGGAGPKHKPEKEWTNHPSLQLLGRNTNPKDLVDMVLEMIDACPQAEEFKCLLMEKIR